MLEAYTRLLAGAVLQAKAPVITGSNEQPEACNESREGARPAKVRGKPGIRQRLSSNINPLKAFDMEVSKQTI